MKRVYDEQTKITFVEPDCVEECLEFIYGISIDYDGYNTAENLKSLIDEIREMTVKAKQFLDDHKFYSEEKFKIRTNEEGKRIVSSNMDCADCICRVCARNSANDFCIGDAELACEACNNCEIGDLLMETDDMCDKFICDEDFDYE